MFYRTIRNDVLKSKAITLTMVMFVAAAAMLVSLSAILIVNLAGAIDLLMTQARTPHFMQMHSGALDMERLNAFAAQNEHVDQFQALEFLNVDGAQILFVGGSLADSVQDNGFVVQSEQFDYLLDLDGEIIQAAAGEVYVPLCYMQDGSAKLGDRLIFAGKQFTVAGFLRDSQMNSLLASSKRFLVSQEDYAALQGYGNIEYLLEFRLKDLAMLGAFENDYTAAGLDANGPTLTYPLFKTTNAISDGMMIGVILLVSVLVVAIALMCIRFTLLARMEDDYREIGVMKAIGLRVSAIKRIYLAKYAAIAAAGCVLGLALSFAFRGLLLENIRLYMGESENPLPAMLFSLGGVLLVFLAVVGYVNGVLNRFHTISPAEAIRFGSAQEQSGGAKRLRLSSNRLLSTNVFLGVKDVLARKRLYATMLAVLVIAAFIVIVPQNLHNTISTRDFSAYMGVGAYDLRIDIQQTDDIAGKAALIGQTMAGDADIARYVVLTTKTFAVQMDDGTEERIKIELGEHDVFPLKYSQGRAAAAEDEIALSVLNANELEKSVGETITVLIDGEARRLRVCGIYSDITNGGKTAKAVFSAASAESMWSVIGVQLADKTLAGSKIAEYGARFDFVKVSSIDEFINQTFGATISAVGKAAYGAIAVALTITLLVTLLFMKMLVAKDRYAIAIMKAFGFVNADITMQYVARSVFVLLIGIVLGTLLANTLGEMLAGAVIASFGAASFEFTVNPLLAYVLCPLLMIGAVLLATLIGTLDAGQIKIAEYIKE